MIYRLIPIIFEVFFSGLDELLIFCVQSYGY